MEKTQGQTQLKGQAGYNSTIFNRYLQSVQHADIPNLAYKAPLEFETLSSDLYDLITTDYSQDRSHPRSRLKILDVASPIITETQPLLVEEYYRVTPSSVTTIELNVLCIGHQGRLPMQEARLQSWQECQTCHQWLCQTCHLSFSTLETNENCPSMYLGTQPHSIAIVET